MNATFRLQDHGNVCHTMGSCDGALCPESHPECGACPTLRWFVLQTEPRCEAWVAGELSQAGFTTFLPQVMHHCREHPARTQSRAKRRQPLYTTRPVPAFPGYLFVAFDEAVDPWRKLTRTMGVKRIMMRSSERPAPVPAGVVDRLRRESDGRLMLRSPAPLFEAGAILRIEDGPFADHNGVCLWNDETRVRVLLDLFGRSTEVTLNRGDVQAAA